MAIRNRLIYSTALACALWLLGHGHARAACTVPYTFINGTTAQSAQVNADFAAAVSCVNNLSGANFGAGGIWASNVIPTTVGQATFGGTQNYTFPLSLVLPTLGTGCVQIGAGGLLGVTGSNCPGSPVPASQGGTSTTGGAYVSGQCFYWNGTTFATKACISSGGVTSVTGIAPITVNNTNPQQPIVGLITPLATQYGGLGVNGSAFSANTLDCIGGMYAGGVASVAWLPCRMVKSSWNGSAYVVSTQNNTPIVMTGVPISFSSCAAASGPSQAACATATVPLPTTPTAWGYRSFSTYTCHAHLEAAGSGGTIPMQYSAVISGTDVIFSVFNPYSFAISASFNQSLGGVCQASSAT